ncbi:Spy/CpxP family protein refolding chaperone [Sphingomonas abietis]|uniref:Spy/CpxP family protein refolding chaperone n=1 Tax=Sphingomonas abietis TaxID=3012344 RepID=A0ABY7NKR1_9SPHN|nr:Spy/CpxP family protein refolding chaperone [Sphingomonas abietis]WBO21390.1 Spy/CpxP family protein refolding chaperone [Sphingomonas abietis]
MAVLLGLRPDQRPALDNFLQSMRPPHGEAHDRPHRAGPDDAGPDATAATFPARLDAMAAAARRHDDGVRQKIASARSFYASLTSEQQQRFDALDDLRHDHGPGHDHGRRGDGRWPHGGMGGFPPPPAGQPGEG